MRSEGVTGEHARTFGDYALLKKLGMGGMGQVWLARSKGKGLSGVDKQCVIKLLRAADDEEYERRFVDEARLIVLLNHKNICGVFDAGCFEGIYYLAMEHIAGDDLRMLQQRCSDAGNPMDHDVAIHIVKEMLEGLDVAHRLRHPVTGQQLHVVHRDVSPQNIMVSNEGEVKVIDFGLAESAQKLEKTAPRIVMGKLSYMSPEQARGQSVDARADQFAVAQLLYELLANERYYGSSTPDELWQLAGRGGWVPNRLSSLSPELQLVINKATAINRDERYASCGDMRDALTAVQLKRGKLAGSREVKTMLAGLRELTARTELAKPEPVVDNEVSLPKAGEKTRTFRIEALAQTPSPVLSGPNDAAMPSPIVPVSSPQTVPAAITLSDATVHVGVPVSPQVAEPTTRVQRRQPEPVTEPDDLHVARSKLPYVVLGLGVLGAAIGIGWLMQPRSTTVDAGPVVAVIAPVAVPIVPVMPVVTDAGLPAIDAGTAAVAVAVAVQANPTSVDVNADRPEVKATADIKPDVKTKPDAKAKPDKAKPDAKDKPDAKPDVKVENPEIKAKEPLPPLSRSVFANVTMLKSQCPKVACTAGLEALVIKANQSDQYIKTLKDEVARCYALCSKDR
jgi:eukaryotic-like serine/threonine-protein kinase